jgi:hypothetical protein
MGGRVGRRITHPQRGRGFSNIVAPDDDPHVRFPAPWLYPTSDLLMDLFTREQEREHALVRFVIDLVVGRNQIVEQCGINKTSRLASPLRDQVERPESKSVPEPAAERSSGIVSLGWQLSHQLDPHTLAELVSHVGVKIESTAPSSETRIVIADKFRPGRLVRQARDARQERGTCRVVID